MTETDLRGRIHKVELEQVLDAERLEEEHRVGEIRALNLGDRVFKKLVAVRHLGKESIRGPSASLATARGEKMTYPAPVRPARPDRWFAFACEIGVIWSESIPIRGL